MIINYIRIALRNLLKYKVFSFISVMGMALSLATCILIGLYVWDELQYDNFHPDGDRTYRVYDISDHGGEKSYLPIVPYPFASYMKKDFPQIESTLRMMDTYGEQMFEANDQKIMESGGYYAEPSVFELLTIHVTAGNEEKALEEPNTIALSATTAHKYFGNENPIGETIKIDHTPNKVTAVFADVPTHFHLKINYLISLSSTHWQTSHENNWQQQQIFTYLKLRPGTDAGALEAQFKPFVEKYAYPIIQPKGFTYVPHLQNIRDIHLHSTNFEWETAQRGNAESVYILSATAVLILLIACLNFVNLSTARSLKRMKEVGVRKVVGAYRRQLILQFTSESIVITLAGLLVAIAMAVMAMPYLNQLVGKHLTIPYDMTTVLAGLLACACIGSLAGCYPAFYLSRFRPIAALSRKGKYTDIALFRQGLVVVQFMFSFFLITGSWIVLSQNNLLQNKNLGFNKDQVIVIPLTHAQLADQETTKARYLDNPNVLSATIGFGLPGDIIAGDEVIEPTTGKTLTTSLFCVDDDFISTMGMKIIAGRDFSSRIPSDSTDAFIFNETALATYGLGTPEEAIGKAIDWNRWDNGKVKHGKIVGVVQDFHFKSLREKVTPVVMQIYPQAAWKLAVRVKPDHMDETLAFLKKTYAALEPNWVFAYSFLDDNFQQMYTSEQRLGKLFMVFTWLAIFVACMGLYGLVENSVNQRLKEISIRKVFGASVPGLINLLTRHYFVLMGIAFVLIMPLSYYAGREWLSGFAYRVPISLMLYLKSALVIAIITLLAVGFKSLGAALSNPAGILKNE